VLYVSLAFAERVFLYFADTLLMSLYDLGMKFWKEAFEPFDTDLLKICQDYFTYLNY
jgi:hypothetical protein